MVSILMVLGLIPVHRHLRYNVNATLEALLVSVPQWHLIGSFQNAQELNHNKKKHFFGFNIETS